MERLVSLSRSWFSSLSAHQNSLGQKLLHLANADSFWMRLLVDWFNSLPFVALTANSVRLSRNGNALQRLASDCRMLRNFWIGVDFAWYGHHLIVELGPGHWGLALLRRSQYTSIFTARSELAASRKAVFFLLQLHLKCFWPQWTLVLSVKRREGGRGLLKRPNRSVNFPNWHLAPLAYVGSLDKASWWGQVEGRFVSTCTFLLLGSTWWCHNWRQTILIGLLLQICRRNKLASTHARSWQSCYRFVVVGSLRTRLNL